MDEHQLFLNIECKLLDKYAWFINSHGGKTGSISTSTKCRCYLQYDLQDEDRRLFPYPPEIHMPCKELPNLSTLILCY